MNEVAIGYFTDKAYLNPPQSTIVTFKAGDRIIVLADDDTEYE